MPRHALAGDWLFDNLHKRRHFGELGMPKTPFWRFRHAKVAVLASLDAKLAISATLAFQSHNFGNLGMPKSLVSG